MIPGGRLRTFLQMVTFAILLSGVTIPGSFAQQASWTSRWSVADLAAAIVDFERDSVVGPNSSESEPGRLTVEKWSKEATGGESRRTHLLFRSTGGMRGVTLASSDPHHSWSLMSGRYWEYEFEERFGQISVSRRAPGTGYHETFGARPAKASLEAAGWALLDSAEGALAGSPGGSPHGERVLDFYAPMVLRDLEASIGLCHPELRGTPITVRVQPMNRWRMVLVSSIEGAINAVGLYSLWSLDRYIELECFGNARSMSTVQLTTHTSPEMMKCIDWKATMDLESQIRPDLFTCLGDRVESPDFALAPPMQLTQVSAADVTEACSRQPFLGAFPKLPGHDYEEERVRAYARGERYPKPGDDYYNVVEFLRQRGLALQGMVR